ncbi:MAG: hypothetical protein H7Z13_03610 [Ferruginibacter sp.]|nr:hypothetical protein [Ferruginibacter sp.]
MLKYLFGFIILLHGLIHCIGFAKAFGYGNITQLTRGISKAAGCFWLITAILFLTATVLFLLKKDAWPVIAIIAAVISQILIIIAWKDAKFGTLFNVIVLMVAIPVLANVQFNKMVAKEVTALLSQAPKTKVIITRKMLDSLPPVVQQWLIHSGVVGKEKIQSVRLKQNGSMLIKPGKKWMPFTASQYFTVDDPAFNWQANVQMMPFIKISGRDKFVNGDGRMLIKMLSLITVANAGGDTKMNGSAMLRFLAETCWFPTAALSDYIKWEAVGPLAAKATMRYKGLSVEGIFQFNTNFDMMSFTCNRWYINGKDATLEKWLVETKSYAIFEGIRIPAKTEVSWKLKSGDFKWLKLEIAELDFNQPGLYK